MTLLHNIKNRFRSRNAPEKRSIISRRFIIAVSIIYSSLIIIVAISFHYMMNKNRTVLRDSIIAHNQSSIMQALDAFSDRIRYRNASSIDEIKSELSRYNATHGDLLTAIFFTKTDDENYFRIADTFSYQRSLPLDLPRSGVVREQKEVNYLKKGLMHSTIDPDIYVQGGYAVQNAYLPVKINRKKGVLQLIVSVSRTRHVMESYDESVRGVRLLIIIVSVVLAAAVALLSLVFLQNYSLLIRNLSRFMKKAADGNLDVSLNKTDDVELNLLAESFNTLIDELKDRTEKASADTEQAPETDGLGQVFNTGVALLKNNRLDESIAIFHTMTIMKPGGFGSYFNLGVAYAKKRDYARALEMFKEAQRLNPNFEITSTYIEKIVRLQNADA
ncbi:MAG: tetratricopeptide repeat protein [Spirochaetes bacterium]|nr:tetratricopeptide repeat protein [Spirochaetota bacterium]